MMLSEYPQRGVLHLKFDDNLRIYYTTDADTRMSENTKHQYI